MDATNQDPATAPIPQGDALGNTDSAASAPARRSKRRSTARRPRHVRPANPAERQRSAQAELIDLEPPTEPSDVLPQQGDAAEVLTASPTVDPEEIAADLVHVIRAAWLYAALVRARRTRVITTNMKTVNDVSDGAARMLADRVPQAYTTHWTVKVVAMAAQVVSDVSGQNLLILASQLEQERVAT